MKGLLPKVAYILVGVLLVAGLLLTLGQRESTASPSANSYGPSGLHAFLELLERTGIETRVDRSESPRLGVDDLAVSAFVETGGSWLGEEENSPIESALERHIKRGGRVLVLPFDRDFRARSNMAIKAATPVVSASSDKSLQISSSPLDNGNLTNWGSGFSSGGAQFLPITVADTTYLPWVKRHAQSGEPFVAIAARDAGILCRTTDGLFATNRFIDRHDNAELAVNIVKGLLPEGGAVVFTEASVGNSISPSLIGILGPWAHGAWTQMLVLFVAAIVALGIRFGLPEVTRRRQRGQREMVDAIADVYRRAKSTAVALDVAYRNADRRIRESLKLPAHLGVQDRDRQLPEDLVRLLQEVELSRQPIVRIDQRGRQHITYRLAPDQALSLISKLDEALESFLPSTRNRIS